MVSILLCTYNRAHLIRESIESILNQTYKDWELLLVDDGSTDRTREILKTYDDPRIRFFFLDKNRYYCRAANYGISQMKGDYLAIANSDDLWYPRKLEIQMEYLTQHPECGACFTYADVIDETGKNADEEFPEISSLLKRRFYNSRDWIRYFFRDGNCIAHPSAVIQKQMLDSIGGFHLLYCQSADMYMWIQIVRKSEIYVIPEVLTSYRCHHNPQDQVSGADDLKAARFMNEHMMIRRWMMNEFSDDEIRQYFGQDFRKKDAATPLEMQIERAFLLMTCTKGLDDLRILGLDKFEEILRNYGDEAVEVLDREYHVTLQNIYEWNLEHFYVDFGIHVKMADLIRQREREEREKLNTMRQLEGVRRMYRESEAEKNTLVGKIQDAKDQIGELKKEIENLHDQITLGQVEKNKVENELRAYRIELDKAGQKIQECEQKNEKTQKELEQQVAYNIRLMEEGTGRRKKL